MNYQAQLRKVIPQLEKLGIVEKISNISNIFYDEPRYYFFTSESPSVDNHTYYKKHHYQVPNNSFQGVGLSFQSKHLALLKSVNETAERFCQSCFYGKNVIFSTYNSLIKSNKKVLDPFIYIKDFKIRDRVFGWVKGFQLFDHMKPKPCLIPWSYEAF